MDVLVDAKADVCTAVVSVVIIRVMTLAQEPVEVIVMERVKIPVIGDVIIAAIVWRIENKSRKIPYIINL